MKFKLDTPYNLPFDAGLLDRADYLIEFVVWNLMLFVEYTIKNIIHIFKGVRNG